MVVVEGLAEYDADWLAELDADWLTELEADVDGGVVAEADPLLVLAVGAGVALSLSTVKVA